MRSSGCAKPHVVYGVNVRLQPRCTCVLMHSNFVFPADQLNRLGGLLLSYEQVDYQRLAAWIRGWTRLDAGSSPWAYVDRLHLKAIPVRHVENGARLVGRCIHWDASIELNAQRCAVAVEMARWCLRVVGEDDSDDAAIQLALAISPSFAESEARTGKHLRLLPLAKTDESKAGRPLPASQGRQQRRASRRR